MRLTTKTTVLAAAVLALSATTALAGGFALREQSAEAQGNSFAGVAAGTDGLSAMFWNPATLATHNDQGLVTEGSVSLIIPYSKASFPPPGSGNIGITTPVPASYVSYGLNDRLTLGMGLNVPFGLGTDADVWALGGLGDKSKVQTYSLTPSIAYELSDAIAVGFGLQLNYMTVDLNNRSGATEVARVKGDDYGIGFTAGVLLKPTATTNIGIGFRSMIDYDLEGRGYVGAPALTTDITAPFKAPETVTLGVSQKVGDQLTLKAGVEWTNWSRFKDLSIYRKSNGTLLAPATIENWKDGWFYSLGGDYAYSDALSLRAGVAYEKSPVQDGWRTVRMPDNDRYWLSLGGSYKMTDRTTASLGYSHVFMKKGDQLQAPVPAGTSFKQHLDILSASLTMDW